MNILSNRQKERYTYQDYLSWSDDERWEIINGQAYYMGPAPKIRHQRILRNLSWQFGKQLNKLEECELFTAPTDVVFDEFNVVQPDILIVCDRQKVTEDNIQGAPDLIIEIASASTELRDKREKLRLYEHFGVKEYIIVFPEREYLERYTLENNKYGAPEVFNWNEVLKLKIFEIEMNLWEVFEKHLPEEKRKC